MTPVRLGFLSTAKINGALLTAAELTDSFQVLAVASRDGAKAQAYAAENGIERPYGSYEELLADPDVEAVYISLPNSMHHEWTLRSLEAGKHVLAEKPYSRHPEEVDEAFDLADDAGLVLMEAFMWRHHPQSKQLKRLVDDGTIGELRLVRAAFSFPLTDMDNVRLRPELDGGALMDVGCYCVSGMRLLAGEPVEVTGQQLATGGGVDLRFTGTLRFEGDVLGHFDCAFDLPERAELTAVGSEGELSVRDPWHSTDTGIDFRRPDGSVERLGCDPGQRYQLQLDNFAAAVRGEDEQLLGRADALGQARTIEALYEAADTARAIAPSTG
jgi:xylose dehydrogenase (NAD/NADP)